MKAGLAVALRRIRPATTVLQSGGEPTPSWGVAEMAQKWTTLKALREIRASPDVRRLLAAMAPSRHTDKPTFDVSSFAEQVLKEGLSKPESTSGSLVTALRRAQPNADLSAAIRSDPPVFRIPAVISAGLSSLFETAQDIRRQTGGKDGFIGLRHLVMAMLTQHTDQTEIELQQALAPLGPILRSQVTADFVEAVIIRYAEPEEGLGVWAHIVERANHPAAARLLDKAAEGRGPKERVAKPSKGRRRPVVKRRPDPPFTADAIAPVNNDDPSALRTDQIVGHDQTATALARVIAARAFKPPLAVGVFGSWGSGKSLFMGRVEREVTRLGSEAGGYHEAIAPVRFNAWHYVDGDLWASLVGHIFETLDQYTDKPAAPGFGVLDRLTTARELSLASAHDLITKRQAAVEAQTQLQVAAQDLKAKRSDITTALEAITKSAAAGLASLLANKDARDFVSRTYGRQIEEMTALWAGPEAALADLRREHAVLADIRRSLPGRRWLAGFGLLLLLLILLPLGLGFLGDLGAAFSAWVAKLQPIGLALTGLLATASGWLARMSRKAVVARDAVVAAAAAYEKSVAEALETGEGDLAVALKGAKAAGLKVVEAQQTLDAAVASEAEAAAAFARSRPGERLKTFVKMRAAIDGPYLSRQGLVSTIRRDFADLADLLGKQDDGEPAEQSEADEAYAAELDALPTGDDVGLTQAEMDRLRGSLKPLKALPKIDRIILYIDDLDRCPFDKVMEVLQAVHLLMAFPLFVVLVAVDVRWLETSLENSHAQFKGKDRHTSPTEYLEKIFQLAMWTDPLTMDDVVDFVYGRLPVQGDAAVDAGLPSVAADVGVAPAAATATADIQLGEVTSGPAPVPQISTLTVSRDEADFIIQIAGPFAMSPRRLLRFLNSYQVARAALHAEPQQNFRELQGLAAALALAISQPDLIRELADRLKVVSDWPDFASRALTDPRDWPADVVSWMEIVRSEGLATTAVSRWMGLALRFSFAATRSS